MANLTYDQRVVKIAGEILAIRPGTHPKAAIREAKALARIRDTYRVSAEEKITSNKKTKWETIPEHIQATIRKQKLAEEERRKAGRELATVKIVSGGGVSPR